MDSINKTSEKYLTMSVIREQKPAAGFSLKGYCKKVETFKWHINAIIRKKVVTKLGKRKLLYGNKIVVRVDDLAIHLLGELDNHEQSQEVSDALSGIYTDRRIENKLTLKPAAGSYRFQKNLL